ncbi:hypothetical protein D2A34_17785 [Clostridium chromiireducens]|uniref:Uncharacterized protein n=2 Tax=Clostridium chromiireducens TaxID=225345 RepID=A0A399IKS2_9CLOT|nr:hypothetical protein [Clostridium chromiireducens]RII33580.1 hypothetical protein D2A34_17785 [Clostridium chromiireducens]
MTQKWYEKNLIIILFLILFFPIGLLLMWKYSKWDVAIKIVILIFFGLFVIINLASNIGNNIKAMQSKRNYTSEQQELYENIQEELNKKTENDGKDVKKAEIKNYESIVDDKLKLKATPNTIEAVDEIISISKKDAQRVSDSEVKEAIMFINNNYNNYWSDNNTMRKAMYYGALLENSNSGEHMKELGKDTVQAVKYVYINVEKIGDKSTQANLVRIKKSLDLIPDLYKK